MQITSLSFQAYCDLRNATHFLVYFSFQHVANEIAIKSIYCDSSFLPVLPQRIFSMFSYITLEKLAKINTKLGGNIFFIRARNEFIFNYLPGQCPSPVKRLDITKNWSLLLREGKERLGVSGFYKMVEGFQFKIVGKKKECRIYVKIKSMQRDSKP